MKQKTTIICLNLIFNYLCNLISRAYSSRPQGQFGLWYAQLVVGGLHAGSLPRVRGLLLRSVHAAHQDLQASRRQTEYERRQQKTRFVSILTTSIMLILLLLLQSPVVITNAVGSLNSAYDVGDLMVIKDHISFPLLALSHPLIGPHDDRIGPRFTPVNNVYMKRLRDVFLACGRELDIRLHEGVYGSVGGPTYETVTDARLCRQTGMDCVGELAMFSICNTNR